MWAESPCLSVPGRTEADTPRTLEAPGVRGHVAAKLVSKATVTLAVMDPR